MMEEDSISYILMVGSNNTVAIKAMTTVRRWQKSGGYGAKETWGEAIGTAWANLPARWRKGRQTVRHGFP
jgi:hypothetical protein